MNVATYFRVHAEDRSYNAQQAVDILSFTSRRSWTVVESFCDIIDCEAKDWRRLLRAAQRRRRAFDVVVVHRVLDACRSAHELVVIVQDLVDAGVGFASVSEPFDTTEPSGLFVRFVQAFADVERESLSKGRPRGRPPAPLSPARVRELHYEQGKSLRQIADELDVGLGSVHRALKNGVPKTPR